MSVGLFTKTKELLSPVSGKVIPLRQVPNKIIASNLMGKGIAVMPTDDKIYAPISGIVTVKSKYEHSYAINSSDNLEIFVHIGLNTMELRGEGFVGHIKKGSIVRAGDLIATIDLDFIRNSGYYMHTLMLITRPPMNGNMIITKAKIVEGGKTPIIRFGS